MKLNISILSSLLFLAVFILPIKPEFTTIPFVLITIYWLISCFQHKTVFNKGNIKILLFTTSTFIVGVLGLINTNNFPAATFELSRTLPIFLLPFILFTFKQGFTNKQISFIISGFVLGSLIKTLFILLIAIIKFKNTGSFDYFFYTALLRETGSFSYYLVLAYYLILFVLYKKNVFLKKINLKVQTIILVFSLFLFSVVIILLQTKSVIIYFYLINVFFFILYIKRQEGRLLLYTLILCSVFMLKFSTEMRFIDFFKTEKTKVEQKHAVLPVKKEQSMESTSLRINSIKTTIAIIKENILLGVGTGDLTDEMTKKYEQLGYIYNLKEQTNPHNQYLRTFGKNGILGVLALIAFFIFNFYSWLKTKSSIMLAFNLTILLCCMTNDLFDTGGGAPFIGLLFPLIYLWSETFTMTDNETVLQEV
ncbi:MAG: O-antigen ligase family protein [Bacteroidales bacterium]